MAFGVILYNWFLSIFFLAWKFIYDFWLHFNSLCSSKFFVGDAKQIFANIRGQWRPAIDCQDLITTVQRYYSNAFSDFERQDAINVWVN